MDEKLLEPLKYYNETLRDLFLKNTEELYDKLVEDSRVDINENRESVIKYNQKQVEISEFDKKLKKFNFFKVLSIIGIVICGILMIPRIYNMIQYKHFDVKEFIICIVCFGVGCALIYLMQAKIKTVLNDTKLAKDNLSKEAEDIQNECFRQLAPLNRLFDSDHTRQLIMKTIPDIIVDKDMKMERFDILSNKYGLAEVENLKDISVLEVLSGEVIGNPYVICRTLEHTLGQYTYTGSLTIHWETYSYDSNGNRITHHHSETLHASLTKPKPYYSNYTYLYYGNEAAPSLSFERLPGHIEKLNEKAIEKNVKKGAKELQKKAKEAVKNGGSFTPIGNDEFEVLFNALDRNNEQEFRLLFTPLAQKNEVDILKHSPYGDDFQFRKNGMLNLVCSEHSANWDTNTFGQRFSNFDIDDSRKRFRDFQVQYFDHFYFQIAPLLAVPLYQQHKPQEYIYKHDYKRNYSSYQTEALANIMGAEYFAHPDTKTNTIIKTHYDYSTNKTDTVTVNAYSYNAFDRVDYIPVYGGDGYYHDVPVNWVEYIPVSQTSSMRTKKLDVTDDHFNEMKFKKEFGDVLNNHNAEAYGYGNGIISLKVTNSSEDESLDKDLEELFK